MELKIPLILASGSAARQSMLKEASVPFEAKPADIDEAFLVEEMLQYGKGPSKIAAALAAEKAKAIAQQYPGNLIVGSDQILEFEGRILHKAQTIEEAKDKLCMLRGKTHQLISAVCVYKGEEKLWEDVRTVTLSMRDFDDAFLRSYVKDAGDSLTQCVGGYAIESHGAWLFEKVKGDYFSILGMPLLPLLGYLKDYASHE